jgi:oligoribonuclease NrnB/cAMP/cGMP phosphodiesterase (DHH superfamily)
MKVIIFSHESDLDGLYSATIGLMRYPQAMTVFLGYGIDNFNKLGNFIQSATLYSSSPKEVRGKIIIADLGLNDELIETCRKIFADATSNAWKIMWVDHHPWSDRAIEAVRPFVEIVLDASGRKCAAELMYETLLPGNIVAEKLASMAHTMDFFTNNQYLTPISELIRYYQTFPDFYYRLSILASKSSKGILWDIEMQNDYNDYVRLREEAKEQVFASMQIREAGRFKVAYIQSSPYLQSSLFSQEVFSKANTDLVMLYSTKGKVSIRRNNDAISCRSIAANLPEGGGHDYAAGATFKSDPSDTAAVISELQVAVIKALDTR